MTGLGTGIATIQRQESPRFYDSTKGAEWTTVQDGTTSDHLMCWTHAAANAVEYWQSYYGVFAKPQVGTSVNPTTGQWSFNADKPLPYGRIGTEPAYHGATQTVADNRQLAVARDMYHNMSNVGGTFKWATEWFFRGATDFTNKNGNFVVKNTNTGGYYANYFGTGEFFEQDKSYTTVYSATAEAGDAYHNSSTGSTFGDTDRAALKELLLSGLGIQNSQQTEKGKVPFIGIYNAASGTSHFITCYGFTTDSRGELSSLLVADPDNEFKYGSELKEVFIKDGEKGLYLYTDPDCSSPWLNSAGYYIGEVSYINTPAVLQNMLAEYSNVEGEAQVWNGGSSTWQAQQMNTNALPTAATGWDILVNGSNIDTVHHGYYHTYATEGRDVLLGDHAAADARDITIKGTVTARHIEVTAAGYSLQTGEGASLVTPEEGGSLLIRSGASLRTEVALTDRDVLIEPNALLELNNLAEVTLHDLTLHGNAQVTADDGTTIVVTGEFRAEPVATSYALRSISTPAPSVQADLDLTSAKAVVLNSPVDLNGHALALSSVTPVTLSFDANNGPVTFFTNIGELSIDSALIAAGTDLSRLLNLTNADLYKIVYNGTDISMIIPEPAAASLGMLALIGMIGRRRRK